MDSRTDSFKDDVKIDRNALEEEQELQGSLYKKWHDRFINAEFETDNAEAYLDDIEEELLLEIRMDPESFLTKKEKEKKLSLSNKELILAVAHRQEKYKKARTVFLKAKRNKGILKGAVGGMEHRRSSLKYLGELWMFGYWSTDIKIRRVPEEDIDRGTERQKELLNKKYKDRTKIKRRRDNG